MSDKPVAWIDCDGVLADSQYECLTISYAAWKQLDLSGPLIPAIPRDLERYFVRYRGWVQPAQEYRALLEGYIRGITISSPAIWQRLKRDSMRVMRLFEKDFFKQRRRLQMTHPDRWLGLHRPYAKPSAWKRLAAQYELRVLTTKDETSTKLILRRFGLLKYFSVIVGKETTQGDKLMWLARQKHNLSRTLYLDDHPGYVASAQHLGLQGYVATWGYLPRGLRVRARKVSLKNFDTILLQSTRENPKHSTKALA